MPKGPMDRRPTATARTPAPPAKLPGERDLTTLQRLYCRGRMAGLTRYRAAVEAGYSPHSAEHSKEKIEKNPIVRRVLNAWLERQGIDDAALGLKENN